MNRKTYTVSMNVFSTLLKTKTPINSNTNMKTKLYSKAAHEKVPLPNHPYLKDSTIPLSGFPNAYDLYFGASELIG